MAVRAKFKVDSVQDASNGEGKTIVMSPVIGDGNPENDSFFKWTPWGEIKFGTVNPAAAQQFVEGQAYYIDFTPAD